MTRFVVYKKYDRVWVALLSKETKLRREIRKAKDDLDEFARSVWEGNSLTIDGIASAGEDVELDVLGNRRIVNV